MPPDAWGSVARADMAGRVTAEAKLSWGEDRFLPGDSFDVLCWANAFSERGVPAWILMGEPILGRPLTAKEVETLRDMSFGQVVDFLLSAPGGDEEPDKDDAPAEG